jgi:tetratricopeptide (TPR) repeat protein
LIQLGQPKEAVQFLQEAVASAPNSPRAWLALAACQNALEDHEAEQKTLQSGLEAIPDSGELHYRLAQIYFDNDQLELAQKHINDSIDCDQEPSASSFALQADILERLDLPKDALRARESAYRLKPNCWSYRVGLASAYADRDQTGDAVKLLKALPQSADASAHTLAARVFSAFALNGNDEYYEEALDRLDVARQMNAGEIWLTLQQARILEKLGRSGPAFFAYQQYVNLAQDQIDEHLLEAVLGVARTALETDQAVVAIATLEQGQHSFPESTELLKMLAPAYIRAGMHQRALAVARQAVELSPRDPALLTLLSQAAAQNQNWDEAIESLEKILEQGEQSPEIWLAVADVAISADRSKKARQSIAQVLQGSGRNDAGLLQSAASLVERLHLPQFSLMLLKRAFEQQNDNLELACRLGELSLKMDDLETAQLAWLRAVDLEPDHVEYLDQAAAVLWRLGRRSSAIGLWQRAASNEPQHAPLQLKLAHALLENGEVEQALNHFQQALDLEPDNLELLLESGQVISQYGSPEGAVAIYNRALTLDSGSIEATLGLARCRLQMNSPDAAREILESILDTTDDDQTQSQAHAMLALAALQMGDLPVAARSFQNAKTLGGADSEQALWLSRTALRMGRWEDALEILDRDQASPTPERINEQLTCRLRIEDARCLYQHLAGVHHHAPRILENHNQGRISELAGWLKANVSFAPWLDDSQTWFAIQQHDGNLDSLIESLLSGQPRPELVHALAIRLIEKEQYQKAMQLLEQSAMPFDTDMWGVLLRGICQLKLNKTSLARETMQATTGNPVISPIASYFKAKCWQLEGDLEQAIDGLNTAVSAWPEEASWHYELAQLYMESRRSDAALPHFQRAAEIEPKNQDFTVAYARCLRDAGHIQDAQAAFAHLIKSGDPQADVLREAGLVALANGDLEHAQHWLSEVAAQNPEDAKSLIGAARAAHRLGNKTRARELSQAAYRLAPDDVQVLTGMAEIEAGLGKLEHALEFFDRALNSSEDQTDIYIARSKLLLQNKRPQEAIDALEQAASLTPDNDHVLSLLAAAYEDLGKYDQAMTVASRAHTIAPLRPIHRLQLGRISRKAGQLDRAVDELSRAEQDHSTDPAFPLELGKAYEARAEHRRALTSYQRAISLNPTLAEPHYRAGVLLKSQKAYAQACQMFERAAELDPNDADILHQLAAVRALSLVHGGITKSVVST